MFLSVAAGIQAALVIRLVTVGLTIAFAAVALAFSEGFIHTSPVAGQWRGDALGLAAGMLWGLTTLTLRATKLATARAGKTLTAGTSRR